MRPVPAPATVGTADAVAVMILNHYIMIPRDVPGHDVVVPDPATSPRRSRLAVIHHTPAPPAPRRRSLLLHTVPGSGVV